MMCSLVCGYALLGGSEKEHFKGIALDSQKQWTRLAEGKDKPFTKEVLCLGHDYSPDLPY